MIVGQLMAIGVTTLIRVTGLPDVCASVAAYRRATWDSGEPSTPTTIPYRGVEPDIVRTAHVDERVAM